MPDDTVQQILLRTPENTSLLKASVAGRSVNTAPGAQLPSGTQSVVWSANAEYYAALAGNVAIIVNAASHKQEGKLDVPGLHALEFSPKANFVITFQKPSRESGNADKNLKLWDWREAEVKLQLYQKSFSRDSWPSLQLSGSEDLVLHQVNNAVNVYETQNSTAGVVKKLGLKAVGGFSLSPGDRPVLAAFVPEGKGIPGFIGLWKLEDLDKSPNSPPPSARRSFFRATSCRLFWNAKGTAVLALTASETDASNKSYYGEQKLHYLAANGSLDCLVPLPKEGPVHDVQWSPPGDHFVTVSGFMPSKTNLFTSKCKMVHDLGAGPYNMVRWNPQGRFLAVAGFGNLPGDIGFHEKQADDKCTPLGAAKAEDGVSLQWAPDGRHVLTATTAPRMRVNNGIQLFRYTGEAVHEQKFPVLLEAAWQPAKAGAFEDRPASPRKGGGGAPAASAAPIRAAGYVPPHVRSSGGASTSGGGHFSLSSEEKPRLGGARSRIVVPGAEEPAAAAPAKPARKRGKGKGKAGVAGDNADPTEATVSDRGGPDGVSEGVGKLDVTGGNGEQAGDPAKRARNLKKRLTQIQQLREKVAAGASLGPEQQGKLDSEAEVLEELRALGEAV